MDFWTREFADEAPVPELPLDFNRPAVKSFAGNKEHFELPAAIAGKLKEICNTEGVSMFALILSVYNIMISKLSNLEDVVIGTSVAGRQHADLEKMAGVFINMLPLRNYPRGNMSFREFLQEVKTRTLTSMENQHQYEELISRLVTERQPNRNPLFDIVLAFHDYDHEELSLPGLTLNLYNSNFHPVAKFDLMLVVKEMEGRMLLTFEYSTDIFRNETIKRFAALFQTIASSVIADMDGKIMDVNVISEGEEKTLLSEFNQTAVAYPADKTFAELFVQQAEKTPDNIAAVSGRRKLTYRELNERSNYYAEKLVERKGKSGIVALYTEPSIDMLVGMLSILKSGSAFLPLDTYENTGRIESILADSGCEILLTQDVVEANVSFSGEKLVIGNESQTENIVNTSSEAAYLIFTSGSTGKPKGVRISNSNLVNYSLWLKGFAGLTSDDKSILTSSYAFDLGYTSVFPALLSGAEVHIAAKALYQSPEDLLSYLGNNGITYLKLTPSLFSTFISASNFADNTLSSLKHIILGGEPLRLGDIKSVQQTYGDIKFINHYGPTETTIGAVAHKITDLKIFRHKTIIGKPINNTQLFILDKYQKLLPAGAIGELCIAGEGVGLGYLNNEEKTNEVFVSTDLCAAGRLYRTGDMARWQPDGTIEFIGRADGQVKINGYRVELGEIENCMLQYEGIKSVIVVVKENNQNKQVVAYYVSEAGVDSGILRTYMSQKLPVYMQPAHYVSLTHIPLTANGKVNRKALPDPEFRINTDDLGQSTVIEEKLLDIWSDVLKMQKEFISKNVNFLELGGNSLTAIQIVSKIKKTFEIDIKLIELFHRQTIKQQGEFIETCLWLNKAGTEEAASEEASTVKKYEISF
jgi:amino acid adenylation domain-containing protein